MSTAGSFFDSDAIRWREVAGEVFSRHHYVRHDYTILAYDTAAGTLDMLVRWRNDGGHCPLHRHTAMTTSVLVLAGEQHVRDVLTDGTLAPLKVRRAGEYAGVLIDITIDYLVADFASASSTLWRRPDPVIWPDFG